jgi:hypothetical protein
MRSAIHALEIRDGYVGVDLGALDALPLHEGLGKAPQEKAAIIWTRHGLIQSP